MNLSFLNQGKAVFLVLFFVQILFAINFTASKVVLTEIDAYSFACLRFLLSGICLVIFAMLTTKERPKFTPTLIKWIIVLSMAGVCLGQVVFLLGLNLTKAVNSSVLATTIPIFGLLISGLRKQTHINGAKILGFLLALAGVLALKDFSQFSFGNKTFIGDLLVLAGCFFLALYISLNKDFFAYISPMWGSAVVFLFGGLLLTPALFISPNWSQVIINGDQAFHISFWFSVIGGTLLTYFLNNWAVKRTGPDKVVLFAYLQPPLAGLIAWSFLGENITIRLFISTLLILLGVICAIKK